MILATVTAAILGIAIGYVIGIWQQSRNEIIPDGERSPDFEEVQSARWQAATYEIDKNFVSAAKSSDPSSETFYNVPLNEILNQVGEPSAKAITHARRITVDAINIDRESGKIVRVILKKGQKSRILHPIFRKAGIRVSLEEV